MDAFEIVTVVVAGAALIVAAASLTSLRSSRAIRNSAATAARALEMAQSPRLELTDASGTGPVKLSLDKERLVFWIANWGRGAVRIERIDLVSRAVAPAEGLLPRPQKWRTGYARIHYAGSSEPRILHEGGKDSSPVTEITIPLASAHPPHRTLSGAMSRAVSPATALLGSDTSGVTVAVELTVRRLIPDEETRYHLQVGVGNVSGDVYTHGLAPGPFIPMPI